jgi:hypothetical protein
MGLLKANQSLIPLKFVEKAIQNDEKFPNRRVEVKLIRTGETRYITAYREFQYGSSMTVNTPTRLFPSRTMERG